MVQKRQLQQRRIACRQLFSALARAWSACATASSARLFRPWLASRNVAPDCRQQLINSEV
nr:hypothetical protein [Variovorax boronicumulans]